MEPGRYFSFQKLNRCPCWRKKETLKSVKDPDLFHPIRGKTRVRLAAEGKEDEKKGGEGCRPGSPNRVFGEGAERKADSSVGGVLGRDR